MFALKIKKILLSFFFITFFLFLLYKAIFPVYGILEAVASVVLYPAIKVQYYLVAPIKSFVKKRKKANVLQKKISTLREKNDLLRAENIELQSTVAYFDSTQEIINFKKRYTVDDAHLAQIIMKQCSDYEQHIFVDRGSVHGITHDMVAVYKNCLLGRVDQVYPYYSKVVLITHEACKIAAYCRTSKARGIHEGCNANYSRLQFVSHLSQLQNDDIIISSGEGLIFPQGFGIGTIQSFEIDGLYYNVVIKPLVNFNTLDYCYLIKKGQ